jgi:hypothetical protein
MQLRASEKTAVEELKAEEQQKADSVSISTISIGTSSMDVRMFHIHQAADAGLLRPVWMEAMDVMNDRDMPRMRDMINRIGENKSRETEHDADRAESAATERVAVAERAVSTERDTAERPADSSE